RGLVAEIDGDDEGRAVGQARDRIGNADGSRDLTEGLGHRGDGHGMNRPCSAKGEADWRHDGGVTGGAGENQVIHAVVYVTQGDLDYARRPALRDMLEADRRDGGRNRDRIDGN